MHRTKSVVAKILVAAIIALILVPAAGAAPGGNGKGKGGPAVEDGTCSSPTLSGPAAVAVGDDYTVEGCGFEPGTMVGITVTEAGGCCLGYSKWADANGELSYSNNAWGAGEYRVEAYVQHNNRWRLAASWSFTAS